MFDHTKAKKIHHGNVRPRLALAAGSSTTELAATTKLPAIIQKLWQGGPAGEKGHSVL